MSRRAQFTVAMLLVALPMTGAGAADLVIGVVNPITGPGADLGVSARQGLEPYLEEVNRDGGVNGMQVRAVFRDDESNPQKAVAAVYELTQKQRVNVLMGANLTNIAVAVNPIVNQAKVPFLTFGTGATLIDPVKFPYTFRTNINTDLEASVLVEAISKKQNFKAAALLVDQTAYGQAGAASLRKALAKQGLAPVIQETFTLTDTDMTGQFVAIRDAHADVVFTWGLGTMLAHAARSAQRLGISLPVYGSIGMHQEGFIDLAGPAGEQWAGTFFRAMTSTDAEPPSSAVMAFIGREQAAYGSRLSKSVMGVALWRDGTALVVDALRRAKSTKGDAIRDALAGTSAFPGLLCTYTLNADKHDGFDPAAATLAYAMGGKDGIRRRLPGLP